MALILSIDTATENATVCLGDERGVIAFEKNKEQVNHASFVQPAIEKIMHGAGIDLQRIDAVAVSAGPGSYTGLRVGLASAKGLCFALDKPLILLNTLQVMAAQLILQWNKKDALYCPMIDARRMEVFTALYDFSLNEILPAKPVILTDDDFLNVLSGYDNKIIFSGSGVQKFRSLCQKENFSFDNLIPDHALGINSIAQQKFVQKSFADLAYSEPFYFKEFFTTAKING